MLPQATYGSLLCAAVRRASRAVGTDDCMAAGINRSTVVVVYEGKFFGVRSKDC